MSSLQTEIGTKYEIFTPPSVTFDCFASPVPPILSPDPNSKGGGAGGSGGSDGDRGCGEGDGGEGPVL